MRASSCATTAARRSRMIYFEDEPGRRRLRHDAGPALRPGESVLHRSMGLATLA
jgi:hypothetical protein